MKKTFFISLIVSIFLLTASFAGAAFAKRQNQSVVEAMPYPYLLITNVMGNHKTTYCKFQIVYLPKISKTTKISKIFYNKTITGFFKPLPQVVSASQSLVRCHSGLYRFVYNRAGFIKNITPVYEFSSPMVTYYNTKPNKK